MSDGAFQLALREMRDVYANRKAIVVLLGISIILAFMAPFGTHEIGPLVVRFGYWAVVVVFTALTATFLGDAVMIACKGKISRNVAIGLSALASAVGVCVVVTALNWLFFGFVPLGPQRWSLLSTVFFISLVISGIFAFLDSQPIADSAPPLLARLPFERRGALLSLSAEDHYVNVRTKKGNQLVLMRLADAMKEVGMTDGLQVHRSHWVARDAIQSAKRDGDRAVLTLIDGTEIPASRKFVPDLKAAGILP